MKLCHSILMSIFCEWCNRKLFCRLLQGEILCRIVSLFLFCSVLDIRCNMMCIRIIILVRFAFFKSFLNEKLYIVLCFCQCVFVSDYVPVYLFFHII